MMMTGGTAARTHVAPGSALAIVLADKGITAVAVERVDADEFHVLLDCQRWVDCL
jgi:hypothetical protein